VEALTSARGDRAPVVLLVEASEQERTQYADYLREQHYRVITAFDTSAALRQALNADVVVAGIQVPGPFDGIELVRRLRADAGPGIVLLTTGATTADRTRALQAGCDAFIEKPCSPQRLLASIRTAEARPTPRKGVRDGRARRAQAHAGGSAGDGHVRSKNAVQRRDPPRKSPKSR